MGATKSGTELNARAILKAAGLTYADLGKVEYLPFGESVELMKNRQLDATLQSAGLGVASIRDLATSIKIVVVAVPADVVAKVGDAAYQPAVMLQSGGWTDTGYVVFKALLAIAMWGAGAIGFLITPLNGLERLYVIVAASFLVAAGPMTNEIGFASVMAFVVWHVWRSRATKPRLA